MTLYPLDIFFLPSPSLPASLGDSSFSEPYCVSFFFTQRKIRFTRETKFFVYYLAAKFFACRDNRAAAQNSIIFPRRARAARHTYINSAVSPDRSAVTGSFVVGVCACIIYLTVACETLCACGLSAESRWDCRGRRGHPVVAPDPRRRQSGATRRDFACFFPSAVDDVGRDILFLPHSEVHVVVIHASLLLPISIVPPTI